MLLSSMPSSPHPAQPFTIDQKVAELKSFLNDAPKLIPQGMDKYVLSFQMENGESISCILWQGKCFITGTDVVKILVYRFHKFGRPVMNLKKFEEGVFSDLRMLKHNSGASLEEPRSPFLEYLFRNNCIRTQKKQKVFYWYSVAHDNLFCDAVERDLKRESNLANINQLMLEQKRHREMYFASQYNHNAAAANFMGGYPGGMMPPPPAPAPNTPYGMYQQHPMDAAMMMRMQQQQMSSPPAPPPAPTEVSNNAQDFGAALGIDPNMVFETSASTPSSAHPNHEPQHQRSSSFLQPASSVTPEMSNPALFPGLEAMDPMQFFSSGAEDVLNGSDPFLGGTGDDAGEEKSNPTDTPDYFLMDNDTF